MLGRKSNEVDENTISDSYVHMTWGCKTKVLGTF